MWLCAELLSLRERVRGLSSEVQRRASEAHEARRNEKGLAVSVFPISQISVEWQMCATGRGKIVC